VALLAPALLAVGGEGAAAALAAAGAGRSAAAALLAAVSAMGDVVNVTLAARGSSVRGGAGAGAPTADAACEALEHLQALATRAGVALAHLPPAPPAPAEEGPKAAASPVALLSHAASLMAATDSLVESFPALLGGRRDAASWGALARVLEACVRHGLGVAAGAASAAAATAAVGAGAGAGASSSPYLAALDTAAVANPPAPSFVNAGAPAAAPAAAVPRPQPFPNGAAAAAAAAAAAIPLLLSHVPLLVRARALFAPAALLSHTLSVWGGVFTAPPPRAVAPMASIALALAAAPLLSTPPTRRGPGLLNALALPSTPGGGGVGVLWLRGAARSFSTVAIAAGAAGAAGGEAGGAGAAGAALVPCRLAVRGAGEVALVGSEGTLWAMDKRGVRGVHLGRPWVGGRPAPLPAAGEGGAPVPAAAGRAAKGARLCALWLSMEQPLAATRLLCLDGPSGSTVAVLAAGGAAGAAGDGAGDGGAAEAGEGVADAAAAARLRDIKDMLVAWLAVD
jgi:hypothetical protein